MLSFFDNIGTRIASIIIGLGLATLIVGGTNLQGLLRIETVVSDMAAEGGALGDAVDEQSVFLEDALKAADTMGGMASDLSKQVSNIDNLFRQYASGSRDAARRAMGETGKAALALASQQSKSASTIVSMITMSPEPQRLVRNLALSGNRNRLQNWLDDQTIITDADYFAVLPLDNARTEVIIASEDLFLGSDVAASSAIERARNNGEVTSAFEIIEGKPVMMAAGPLRDDWGLRRAVVAIGFQLTEWRIQALAKTIGANVGLFLPGSGMNLAIDSFDREKISDVADMLLPDTVLKDFTAALEAGQGEDSLVAYGERRLNLRQFDLLYRGMVNGRGQLVGVMLVASDVTEAKTNVEKIQLAASDAAFEASLIDDERKVATESAESARSLAMTLTGQVAQIQQSFRDQTAKASAVVAETSSVTLIALLLVAGVIVMALYMIAAIVIRPLTKITRVMTQLAENDLNCEIPHQNSRGEIGAMARMVNIFKNNALDRHRLEAEQRAAEQKAAEEQHQLRQNMANDFEASVGEIVRSLGAASDTIESQAGRLSSLSDKSNKLSSDAAGTSEQSSENVRAVAAAAEELNLSIGEISRQSSQASAIAHDALTTVEDTQRKSDRLTEAVDNIDAVVEIITEIAAQTNMLALNATIEAERAGEAGLGFTVVANEVKALSRQTAEATDEISRYVEEITTMSRDSVDASQKVGSVMRDIANAATGIASAVEEQRAATQEISRAVEEVSQGTNQVRDNISHVGDAANHVGQSAASVHDQAQILSSQSKDLGQRVDSFLETVRG